MAVRIESARVEDLEAVFGLRRGHHLPLEGLRDHLATTIVARQDGRLVGTAALEVYADAALLRSVAVAVPAQGRGLGHALTQAALQLAREVGAPVVFLLTTTADRFFPAFGFESVERTDVPASIHASVEFTSACPSTATVMRKPL